MKIAFALYVALTWDMPDGKQILDLHKTYETKEACLNAVSALEYHGALPISLYAKAVMDYFCIEVPGE